jgi:hypothetical protein
MQNKQDTISNFQTISNNQISITKERIYKSIGFWLLDFKICLYLVSCILVVVLFSGCANVVTSKSLAGQRVTLTITLRGEPETRGQTYAVVFGTLAVQVPYAGYYFFLPGKNYEQDMLDRGSLAYYYNNHFYSWMDFITLENNNFYLTKGPFTAAASHYTFQASLLSPRTLSVEDADAAKKITLSFDLSQLSAAPLNLYFNVITTDSAGIVADTVSGNNYISTVTGTRVSTTLDVEDQVPDATLDIVSWSAVVL